MFEVCSSRGYVVPHLPRVEQRPYQFSLIAQSRAVACRLFCKVMSTAGNMETLGTGYILGLYWDNGKENGNYHNGESNGKENGK